MERKHCNVAVRLVSNRKPCNSGHKIGDEWVISYRTPGDMCFAAYNSIFPFALVLMNGGTFPWQPDPDVLTVSCPDHEVVNVFELRRIPAD